MNFISGRDLITHVLESDRPEKQKNFVIDQILWDVARHDSEESANSLIHFFDLYMFERGSHTWFDAPNANDHRPIVGPEYVKMERDLHSKKGRKLSSKGVK